MTTQVDGLTGVSQCQPNSVSQDDLQSGVAGKGPAFSAYQSVAQVLAVNTPAKLLCQTELYDFGDCFANSRFTVPAGFGGVWELNGQFRLTDPASNGLVELRVNGSLVRYLVQSTQNTVQFSWATPWLLVPGDFVEIWVSSAIAQTLTPNPPGWSSNVFSGYLARAV